MQLVKFASRNRVGFFDALKKRVDEYFTANNIEKHGTSSMKWKSVAIISIYLMPYFLLIFGLGAIHITIFYGLWILLGIGMIGVGCSIMHDSNHGSFSGNKKLNKYLGKVIMLIGGYDVTWRLQHNVLHHTYTNIEGLDHDIDSGNLLRFSPNAEKRKMHKYQHFYAWFLYGLLSFQWATIKDFMQVVQYEKLGLLKKEKLSQKKALWQVSIYKVIYYAFILVLPLIFSGVAWYHVLIGFFIMHFVAGLSLSCIFQLAHVMGDCEFPVPNDENKMENSWAIHQMLNTADFAPKSRVMGWFIGGLNYQVEHHLFPQICHVHYRHISRIVKDTAKEFGVPYYEKRTFLAALISHVKLLKSLGRA